MSNDPLGGMHTRPVPLDRLAQLEQQVRTLQSQINALRAEPRPQTFYQAQLCRTRSDSTYPTSGSGANAFEVVDLDMEFTESEGDNPATLTELSATSQRVGKTPGDNYIEEGTECLRFTLPNRKQLLLPLGGADSTCRFGIATEGINRRPQGSYILDHGEVDIYTVDASHTLVPTGESIEAYNATSSNVYAGALLLLGDDASGRPLVLDHISSARLSCCSGYGGSPFVGTLPYTIPITGVYGGAFSGSGSNDCYADVGASTINFPAARGIYLIDWSVGFRYTAAPDQDTNSHLEGLKAEPYFDGSAVTLQGRWAMFYLPPLGPGSTTLTHGDNYYVQVAGQFAVRVDDTGQTVQFKVGDERMALNARGDFAVFLSFNCHAAGPGELAVLEDFSVPWRE